MILWSDGPHDAVEQMRRDAALLRAAERGGRPPVLRLFRFEPAGITLGRAQDPARTLELDRCRAAGVAWAVRPTGGGAIFHDQEWTYSFAVPRDDRDWGGAPRAVFERVTRLIAASLAALGVPVQVTPATRAVATPGAGTAAPNAACFATSARHEITRDGRKLAGSAQRQTSRAILIQGSVLLGPGQRRLADYLSLDPEARAALRATLAASATDAGDVVDAGTPVPAWARALEPLLPPGTVRRDGEAGMDLLG
jgi:lipoate-protein ligase A